MSKKRGSAPPKGNSKKVATKATPEEGGLRWPGLLSSSGTCVRAELKTGELAGPGAAPAEHGGGPDNRGGVLGLYVAAWDFVFDNLSRLIFFSNGVG